MRTLLARFFCWLGDRLIDLSWMIDPPVMAPREYLDTSNAPFHCPPDVEPYGRGPTSEGAALIRDNYEKLWNLYEPRGGVRDY